MSYLVLARKWRPRTFDEVVGQDHVTRTLKKAVEKDRLAHAYLFSGPRGCGKTTTARLLAKVINCETPEGAEPCNTCPSCTAVNAGRHLDVIEIDGASNRGIDEIRDLREKIGYASSQGRSKIYIIDEVHMLTPQAFNALLKTLEEPPSHVYMVFATTEPHKVPPTILSRCQRFNFKRLELGELNGQLEKICKSEKIKYDGDALVLISRRAEGSMRDAESLLDQCVAAAEDRIDLDLVRQVLGLVDSHVVSELLKAISLRDTRSALGVVDGVVSSGLDIEEFFLAYIEGVRNLLVLSVEGRETAAWLDLTTDEISELRGIGEVFRTEDLLFLFRSAVRAFRGFRGSSQPRYHLEATIAEAASWDSTVELSELLDRLEAGCASPGGGRMPDGGGGGRAGATGSGWGGGGNTGVSDVPERGPGAETSRPAEGNGTGTARGKDPAQSCREGAFATMDARQKPPVTAAGTAACDPLSELGGREQWERFISQVRETKLTLGIWLMSADVKEVRGERLVLDFRPQNRFAREMVREEKNKRYIEVQLERFFGRKLSIETGESDIVEHETETKAAERKPILDPGLEKVAGEQPMVRRLIEEFEGELYSEDQ